jgi:phosphocarrier protein HPr
MIVFKTFIIQNPLGLQMRAAAQLVQILSRYKSEITVWKGQSSVNGKSLISLLTLAAGPGTLLKFVADGEDADEVIHAIFGFFHSGIEIEPAAMSHPLV